MKQYQLNDKLTFSIEHQGSKVRLIVSDGHSELVCRKERASVLMKLKDVEDMRLFKGRLQLLKKEELVYVIMKDEMVGTIALADFIKEIKS